MAGILQQRTVSLALGYRNPEMNWESAESPIAANFWRDFFAPSRLAALQIAPKMD